MITNAHIVYSCQQARALPYICVMSRVRVVFGSAAAIIETMSGNLSRGTRARYGAPKPVVVQKVHCVKGGLCKGWQHINVVRHMSRDCVALGTTKTWLQKMVSGRRDATSAGTIANFIVDCRAAALRSQVKIPRLRAKDPRLRANDRRHRVKDPAAPCQPPRAGGP